MTQAQLKRNKSISNVFVYSKVALVDDRFLIVTWLHPEHETGTHSSEFPALISNFLDLNSIDFDIEKKLFLANLFNTH